MRLDIGLRIAFKLIAAMIRLDSDTRYVDANAKNILERRTYRFLQRIPFSMEMK